MLDMSQTVIISGASTGIGRAIALDLDARGFRIFAGVRRDSDAEALRGLASDRLTPLMLDVTDADSIAAAAHSVEAAVGAAGLHAVVNNAGIGMGGVEEFIEVDDLRRLFEVNVFGVLATTRAFLPLVRRAHGRIVHIGSMGGFLTSPFLTPYSATKHAIEAFADGLRRELRPWGLQVVLIEPGSIQTPIWEKGAHEAARMRADLPARGEALYGAALDAYLRYAAGRAAGGVSPERVAEAVHHALTAARPRTRYRVGRDAKLMWWVSRLLPDRALDALLERSLRLPRTAPDDA
jgi:NAD(P)-dependent dehydrogenase (short-subunit alcohol dehydrogenase family)